MRHETIDSGGLTYPSCRYGMSRLTFRGPKQSLDKPYLAFIGGTETYGKFIADPFPALVAGKAKKTCINFGTVNGGVDAFVNDPTVMSICHDAEMTVVQVMGANFLSNRFYSVHPRRNDRFLRASTVMQAIFHDVDFSQFTFTRHMLGALYKLAPERFEVVVSELRAAWVARMRNMLGQTGPRVALLWFSRDPMTDLPWFEQPNALKVDPLFITKEMIDELRPLVKTVIEVVPTATAQNEGTKGMHFPPLQSQAASEMLSVASHHEAGTQIAETLRPYL